MKKFCALKALLKMAGGGMHPPWLRPCFKKPVLLLRSENISGPIGMALNCAPLFKFLGTPLLGNAHGLS